MRELLMKPDNFEQLDNDLTEAMLADLTPDGARVRFHEIVLRSDRLERSGRLDTDKIRELHLVRLKALRRYAMAL
jgi:hypothetical protein